MRGKALSTVVALLLTGVLLAGCDSGDDGAEGESTESASQEWVAVTDEASGITVALPEEIEPRDWTGTGGDGNPVTGRSYFTRISEDVEAEIEVGFRIVDLNGGVVVLEEMMNGEVNGLEGTFVSRDDVTVDEHEGFRAEVTFGDGYVAYLQYVEYDDHVLQLGVTADAADGDQAEQYFDQMTGSITVDQP